MVKSHTILVIKHKKIIARYKDSNFLNQIYISIFQSRLQKKVLSQAQRQHKVFKDIFTFKSAESEWNFELVSEKADTLTQTNWIPKLSFIIPFYQQTDGPNLLN